MEQKILDAATRLMEKYAVKDVLASDYGIEPGSEVVFRSLDLPDTKNKRLNLNVATEFGLKADPPFEWKLEITFYDPDSHFLILPDGKLVRTERKSFFDATPEEMAKISQALETYA